MTSVGFEPTPIKTTALTLRLRPLGHDVRIALMVLLKYKISTVPYLSRMRDKKVSRRFCTKATVKGTQSHRIIFSFSRKGLHTPSTQHQLQTTAVCIAIFGTMPKRGNRRKKTRTHVVENEKVQSALTSSEALKVPRSLVVRVNLFFHCRFSCTNHQASNASPLL